jgi:hypothetical protein
MLMDLFHMIEVPLSIIGIGALVMLGLAGTEVMVKGAIAKVSATVKDGMAAKHVVQAIAEFKTNHPEIAKLYATAKKDL